MNIAIALGDAKFAILTNEGLKVGDKVFPCVYGQHIGGKFYPMCIETIEALTRPEKVLACTGWPSAPHTVKEFHTDDERLLYINTDKGYGPAESYFKVIE